MKIKFYENDDTLIEEITLSTAEVVSSETAMLSIIDWVENAIKNRARKSIDDIVTLSGRGSKFTEVSAKETIINTLVTEEDDLIVALKDRD